MYFSCRKHGDKPWTVRWFTFDGHELKYFKSATDKVCIICVCVCVCVCVRMRVVCV